MKAEASFILNKAAINKIDGTEARHYSELAEEAARNAEADAERAEEVAREMESLDGRLDALEETVGDSSAGLVKDVADAQGDITALETTVGDSSAGLVKDVSDAQGDITDLQAKLVKEVTVSGTDPVITATANTRYICGTVTTLSFTPAVTGISEVIFTSGSLATVLTLPNTVKMPEWFSIETNHIYEISILNGVYGGAMLWPTT